MRNRLDLILPCYNPPDGWVETIIEHMHGIQSRFPEVDVHLKIVNDSSTRPILPEEIDHLKDSIDQFEWLEQPVNRGKGAALRKGMSYASGSLFVFTDIDFPYTLDSSIALIQALLSEEADIVVGQRAPKYYEKTPWQRKIVSKMLKAFNKYVLRVPVADSQVGLKGFNQKGLDVFMKTTINRYLFDLEFLILASRKKRGLRIKQVPVDLRDDVVFSKLNWKILSSEWMNVLRITFTAWLR